MFSGDISLHKISGLSIDDNLHPHNSQGFVTLTTEGILTLADCYLDTFSRLVLDSLPGTHKDLLEVYCPPLFSVHRRLVR